MRSGELARLAGVSVRTLRHYHQVGVLAEPERAANGYREYDVRDLVRLLRIRRLAALGVTLEVMPPILDEPGADTATLLDDLDAELTGQIDRLTRQREVVGRLRSHRALPDLPPELAPFQAAFESAGLSREMAGIDRDQVLLLGQLLGTDGMAHLARVYERIAAPETIGEMAAVMHEFGMLHDGSAAEDVAGVAERFAAALRPLIADVVDAWPAFDERAAAALLGAHSDAVLNEAQRRVLVMLEERMEGIRPSPRADRSSEHPGVGEQAAEGRGDVLGVGGREVHGVVLRGDRSGERGAHVAGARHGQ